jgi:hypothetical protein
MAGKASHASKLADHLSCPVDAACMINKPGATATLAIGGFVGVAASAAATRRPTGAEIKVMTNGWLAVCPGWFALVNGDKLLGNPKGDPYAEIPFASVEHVEIEQGTLITRATVSLLDGRTFAFETKRKGPNKTNPEVLELLAERCAGRREQAS